MQKMTVSAFVDENSGQYANSFYHTYSLLSRKKLIWSKKSGNPRSHEQKEVYVSYFSPPKDGENSIGPL